MIELLRIRPGMTARELAEALGRSARTVYRWLDELSMDLGTPLRCNGGGYYLIGEPGGRHDLDARELLALRLSLKSAPFADGSPIRGYAESAWRKIRDSASNENLATVKNLAAGHAVTITAPSADIRSGILETLESAVNTHHRLRVVYRSQKSGRVKEYTLDPYAVVFRRHGWYLLAFCREYGRVIQFKLVRFQSATDLGIQFNPPADFSVDDYFSLSWEAWGGGEPTNVKVKFSPRVARMVSETKRHPTQVVHPQPDGGIIYEVTVAGIEEIAFWIMGYGREAVVLEPESLRNYIADHVRGMTAHYASPTKKDVETSPALT